MVCKREKEWERDRESKKRKIECLIEWINENLKLERNKKALKKQKKADRQANRRTDIQYSRKLQIQIRLGFFNSTIF